MSESTALVTGANKGIGLQIARQLAAVGLTVYVGSPDPQQGQRVVNEIGGRARLTTTDWRCLRSVVRRGSGAAPGFIACR